MNREEAKSKVMTIYGSLSEDMKQAIDVLVDAPEEGQEWVPIAERMPEHAGLYLLLYERRCGIEEMAMVSFSVHTPGQFTFEYEAKQDILRPIAWLPITPYKQEGKE